MVRIGDTAAGSPGIRVQTFTEPTFEFKVLVDAFATYNFVELPIQPSIAVVAGPPVLYKAVLPTQRRVGDVFNLGFKGEDKWGNPTAAGGGPLHAATPHCRSGVCLSRRTCMLASARRCCVASAWPSRGTWW